MMPTHDFKYLIIGGGMTADAAVRGIRQIDSQGSIGLISDESDPPYNRPPLSKGLWKKTRLERIWRKTSEQGVELFLGHKAECLSAGQKQVVDDQGTIYTYEKLLLATGGSPIRLPFGGNDIIYYRYLSDYRALRALTETKQRFVVIGGGFIGSELASSLRMLGKEVSMIFLEEAIGARLFPRSVAFFLNEYYRSKGVQVLPDSSVAALEKKGDNLLIHTSTGVEIEADGVVAGLGIRPNINLARQADLLIDNGIVVDDALRTSQPDIYAAGDVISFYNRALDKRLRVEHEEHANQSGLLAGQSMAGQDVHYNHLPAAYSDVFDLGYETVGELNPYFTIVEDWQEPFKKGVLYYLNGGRVRGVLLWNFSGKTDAARQIIAAPGPFTAADLIGKIS